MTTPLDERLDALGGAHPQARALIEPWLRDGEDLAVYRACPLMWGHARGIDGDVAIDILLHAVQAGLLRIGWELTCPHCGNILHVVDRLSDAKDHAWCDLCRSEQHGGLDDWLHVTFTVRPDVRAVRFHHPEQVSPRERSIYCEASVGVVMRDGTRLREFLDREVAYCDFVAPGQEVEASIQARPGMLMMKPRHHLLVRGEGNGATRVELTLADDGPRSNASEVRPGPVTIAVRNRGTLPQLYTLLQSGDGLKFGPPAGCPAARLIHHPTYAALFPSQLVCAGGLAIRDVTLLFSDLVRSTAMYRELGDLRAYERVREHFTAIGGVLSAHHGLWIKDMGDAVMASFTNPDEAVHAALGMRDAVRTRSGLELKIGIHCGSGISVTFRDRLDWFGSTVNLAARVQSLAGPGEVCVSQAVYQRSTKARAAAAQTPFEAHVRGLDEPVLAYRIAAPD